MVKNQSSLKAWQRVGMPLIERGQWALQPADPKSNLRCGEGFAGDYRSKPAASEPPQDPEDATGVTGPLPSRRGRERVSLQHLKSNGGATAAPGANWNLLMATVTFGGVLFALAGCRQLESLHFSFLDGSGSLPDPTSLPAPSSHLRNLTIDKGRLEHGRESAEFLYSLWPRVELGWTKDYADPTGVWEPVGRVLEVLRRGGRVTRSLGKVEEPWSSLLPYV
ncbi:hypothetical protein CALCODRAFT_556527 [Calocera cornea HHB12733]|uniref:Uncharacterized protein n=1 Tax=Calocera cornea HHB12733 TaxID=1353952 RepID=A0A165EPM2_9BASI|nr:hypothetical protein CALCODRAFT_556527 [Calocera cornea HHB12733]